MFRRSLRSMTLAVTVVATLAGIVAISAPGFAAAPPTAPAAAPKAAPSPAPSAPAAPPAAKSTPPAPGASPAGTAPQASEPNIDPVSLPAVVARLDGQDIAKTDLLAQVNEAQAMIAQRTGSMAAPTRSFFQRVLEDIIANRLMAREGRAQGLSAPPDQVEQRLKELRGQFPDEASYKSFLGTRGFDEDRLRHDMAETIVVRRFILEKIGPTVHVTPEDSKKFYDEHPSDMHMKEAVHGAHILIGVAKDATPEQKSAAKKKAEDLLAQVKAGGDFAALARDNSTDEGSKGQGGDLGWIGRGDSVPPFDQALFAAAPGTTVDHVVETQFGFHIIQSKEKHAERQVSYDEAKPRIEDFLKRQKLGEAVQAKVAELRGKAKVDLYL